MGDGSCTLSRGFESRRRILDGDLDISHIDCKYCIVCLKRPKINKKRGRVWPIKKSQDINSNESSLLQVEINNFRDAFERGEDPLADMTDASDINSVAGVFKLYLRELREPVFPIIYFDQFMELARKPNCLSVLFY